MNSVKRKKNMLQNEVKPRFECVILNTIKSCNILECTHKMYIYTLNDYKLSIYTNAFHI